MEFEEFKIICKNIVIEDLKNRGIHTNIRNIHIDNTTRLFYNIYIDISISDVYDITYKIQYNSNSNTIGVEVYKAPECYWLESEEVDKLKEEKWNI